MSNINNNYTVAMLSRYPPWFKHQMVYLLHEVDQQSYYIIKSTVINYTRSRF